MGLVLMAVAGWRAKTREKISSAPLPAGPFCPLPLTWRHAPGSGWARCPLLSTWVAH